MNPHALAAWMLLGFTTTTIAQQTPDTKGVAEAPGKPVLARFSADGTQILITSTNDTLRLWDVKSGKPLSGQPAHLGTWRLVSFKYGDASNWTDAPQAQRRIKLITATHFTWVEYEVSSGKVQSSAGGTYSFDNGKYTELIEFAGEGMDNYLGKKQPFTIRVEEDKLHQSGQLSDGTKIEEIWQRLK